MSKSNFQVGHRYLVKNNDLISSGDIYEIEILEISPGGKIKLKHCNSGFIDWTDNKCKWLIRGGREKKFEIVEDLGDSDELLEWSLWLAEKDLKKIK